ncbi:hypothetical protein ACWT_4237 [Actinoplanes sp. SE50]|uniref:YbaB/EbfC family nucleoid-associated protein n=1 Tax=unclassified Actinoplanes TaxID=2626549 RepID=UPI00023EC495|nr:MULTISPECIES: YbaB/EbfC family nucleoid-associated protein [unclassified Actinoplanes]AEV85257.1 hypothetical protein ACPL_4366 [Actinoplanes sp. SE50/110]ATO83652.1 hypothetical protein ACWT_4237 [Actinoplanes sp. SE50]SLM01060.1 hypothetical protein ACSP50_4293 [Actinoplanes sp. SE50/110]
MADTAPGLGPDLHPGAAQSGADDDGLVRVRLGPDGRMLSLEVDARWPDRLPGPEALTAAILTAYRQALLKRMAARLLTDPAAAPLPDVTDAHWLAGIRDALDGTLRRICPTGPARHPAGGDGA